ncbi:hypothetical protein KSK55_04505 [Methanospirillum purgamenti]|uniref:Uncharacterized protein n=1 Tax=Methanospirillum hungatei TaxID=2203 RepID=A0A8F5VQ00_METHU|nr:hypothetical protein [Methanospirillum hungatei]QXO95662.1 hypothetical protein KSK55_04505 [Methanospirillum hungatei]
MGERKKWIHTFYIGDIGSISTNNANISNRKKLGFRDKRVWTVITHYVEEEMEKLIFVTILLLELMKLHEEKGMKISQFLRIYILGDSFPDLSWVKVVKTLKSHWDGIITNFSKQHKMVYKRVFIV